MLFNSWEFLLGFLPATLGIFFLLGRWPVLAAGWLGLASLVFYGWWSPAHVWLLLASITLNFLIGGRIQTADSAGGRRGWLVAGLALNLCGLAFFKYADMAVGSANAVCGLEWTLPGIVLPLGISFFTFTQIAFLVDVHAGGVKEYRFIHYILFVTYFPHLIAGPVLHHREMMPQFGEPQVYRPQADNLCLGFSVFVFGLAKKVLLADTFSGWVGPVFDGGGSPGFLPAWGAALCYSLQLYFDFSGYSDMAVGLSRMIGVRLPLNFSSPYKATSIAEFWRCWHQTLSRFLRDYLYIPLGGNRKGSFNRYRNLLITMVLGGLWHGAGWNFAIWGGLHGLYLCLQQAWGAVWQRLAGGRAILPGWTSAWAGRLLTFTAVCIAWVFFRATSLEAAGAILSGMAGQNGPGLPASWAGALGWEGGASEGFGGFSQLAAVGAGLALVWCFPNTQQWFGKHDPALESTASASGWERLAWNPGRVWALLTAVLLVACLLRLNRLSEFIYFQF